MSAALISQKLAGVLADFPEISLVYLFGSQVTGQTGPLSDYDLAIMGYEREDDTELQSRFQHAMVMALDTARVDVVLLCRAPVELAYQIIAQGEMLYQRDISARVEYEAGVLSRYGDYLSFLRSSRKQILQGDAHARRIQRYRAALRRTQRALGQARTPAKENSR